MKITKAEAYTLSNALAEHLDATIKYMAEHMHRQRSKDLAAMARRARRIVQLRRFSKHKARTRKRVAP